MTYEFKTSLKHGQKGEEILQTLFPTWIRSSGYKEDFITDAGKLVEVKYERRTTIQTPNLALELMSSPGRPGAIARAVADNIHFIVYLFADNKYFVYEPEKLLQYMNDNEGQYRIVKIPNRTYETTIVLIPRADVAHLEVNL